MISKKLVILFTLALASLGIGQPRAIAGSSPYAEPLIPAQTLAFQSVGPFSSVRTLGVIATRSLEANWALMSEKRISVSNSPCRPENWQAIAVACDVNVIAGSNTVIVYRRSYLGPQFAHDTSGLTRVYLEVENWPPHAGQPVKLASAFIERCSLRCVHTRPTMLVIEPHAENPAFVNLRLDGTEKYLASAKLVTPEKFH